MATKIHGKDLQLDISSIATAAGTTTLVWDSPFQTIFTGVTTQTIVLPNATTMFLSQRFKISNNSTGLVTVQTNGGATFWIIAAGTDIELVCTSIATAAGTWEKDYRVGNAASGKVMTVNSTMTLQGVDGAVYDLGNGGELLNNGRVYAAIKIGINNY